MNVIEYGKSNEILQFIIKNGMLDISDVQSCMESMKKKELLNKHPYKIWQGKDGYWHTYLPKSDGGRRPVKKKTEKDIKQSVIEYWQGIGTNKFKKRYKIWIERQRLCGRSDNTIYKYEKDYDRFFKGDIFEDLDVCSITEEQISMFIIRLLERKAVQWRALKSMFGYMNGVFEKSIVDGIIDNNPCKRVDLPIFRKRCTEPTRKTDAERTVSAEEKTILLQKLKDNESVERYAVEFSFCVGMRVGEIAALKWEDIDFDKGVVVVSHSEKYNQITKEYSIESTKTGKTREIPLTSGMKVILFKVRDLEIKRGTYGEFVFMDESGRVRAKKISNCINNYTKTKEFSSVKSIHAVRRTINSNMRCNGVSATVAAAILGHSEKVNEMNYTYNMFSMDEKRKILDDAIQKLS